MKSLQNPTKINANAERGDKSAKLVVSASGRVLGYVWEGFGRGLGLQVGAKLSQVGPKIEILASSGCSWAPFGRILAPKSCQHGIPRKLQEWIFGGFSKDFNADFTYFYQQVSKYERHWAAAQDTVCLARGPRRKTQNVLHESRSLLGRWPC